MVSHQSLPANIREQAVSLVDVLRYRTAREGDKTAFRFLSKANHAEEVVSYAKLDGQARSIASYLLAECQPGDRITLLYPAGLAYIAAFMGCLYAGMVAVPLYPPRPNQKRYRASQVFTDSGTTLALTHSDSLLTISGFLQSSPDLRQIQLLASDQLPAADTSWSPPALTSETLAFLQYTSGSTGSPKGVMVSHGNIIANARTMIAAGKLTPADTFLSWLPMYHDMGLIGMVLQAIYGGFATTLMPAADFVRDPIRWLEEISRLGTTISGGPNFGYQLCCERITPDRLAHLDLSQWRLAFNGAEPVRAETLTRFAETFAPAGFRSQAFFPCYGMAETTLFVSGNHTDSPPTIGWFEKGVLRQNQARPVPPGNADGVALVACGNTHLTDKVIIADSDRRMLSPGSIGEIWVQSTGKAMGYWQQAEASKHCFEATLVGYEDNGHFLRTGDLGFLFEDELFITGRLKDLIIFHGRNYYPQDLERCAERAHPALSANASAAFSVFQDGVDRLVLVLEIKRSAIRRLDQTSVFSAIRMGISEHHELAVHDIVMLKPGRIPKTSSGKIQRHACKADYLAGDLVVLAQHQLEQPSVGAAQTVIDRETLLSMDHPQEAMASQIHAWVANALDLDPQTFADDTQLTALGMSSMAAISLQHSLERHWGMLLPLNLFLTGHSVMRLTQHCIPRLKAEITFPPAPEKLPTTLALAPNQRSLWHFLKLAPESAAYNLPFAVRFRMDLDIAALKSAFSGLLNRHRMLRAVIQTEGDQPVLKVGDQTTLALREQDARAWSANQIREYLEAQARRPFDLEDGPLLRLDLLKCGKTHFILLLNMSHIIGDMWSLLILLDELRIRYSARGEQLLLEPPGLDYADYVHEACTFPATEEGKRQWAYWERQLGGELPYLELATDLPRPVRQTTHGASYAFRIGQPLSQGLQAVAREAGVTQSTLLLATFQVLLHRYAAQQRVLVGIPSSGRSRAGYDKVIGFFVNPLVILSDYEGRPSFRDFLSQTQRHVTEALAHSALPFQTILTGLDHRRDPARSPLFQAMFAYQEPHQLAGAGALALREDGARLDLGEFGLETVGLEPGIAQFDLTLFVAESETGFTAKFEYNRDLFFESTIQRMAQHWHELLAALLTSPAKPLDQLSPLSADERRLVFGSFNPASNQNHLAEPVPQAFLARVNDHPHAAAIICDGEVVSYATLAQRAHNLASYLVSMGVGPESLVGICFKRSPQLIEAALGVMLAGGAYVPLDPSYPHDRLVRIIQASGMVLLLTDRNQAESLPAAGIQIRLPDQWANGSRTVAPPVWSPDQTAYVIYTSGSTGQPKGVAIPQRGLCNLVGWHRQAFSLVHGDQTALTAGPGFDASVWEIWPSLTTGATIHILPQHLSADPKRLRDWFIESKITVGFLATPLAEAVLHLNWPADTQLRFLLTGGDKLHGAPPAKLPFQLVNNYGPTENSVVATYAFLQPAKGQPPIGKPIHAVNAYVLNRFLAPVPIGAVGELYLAGASLARGYLHRRATTATAFIPNPFAKNGNDTRLYRTGDLVRYSSDGNLHFLGRMDQQIQLRGFRIELGDIENALCQLDDLEDALVLLGENQTGESHLVAYLTGTNKSPSELRTLLQSQLPGYMVPTAYVVLDHFPLTANGKINRRALAAPQRQHLAVGAVVAAPRNGKEALLCEIWREVLHASELGIHDNFFELGGDSILAIQIMTKANQAGLQIAPGDLFTHPTIAHLAQVVNKKVATFGTEPSTGPVTPTAIQQWFLASQMAEPEHFNQSVLLEIDAAVAPPSIRRALDLVHDHHDALRLRFHIGGHEPIHHAALGQQPLFAIYTLGIGEETLEELVLRQTKILQRSMNLSMGPLLTSGLFISPGSTANILFLAIHHLVVDGVSWRILLEDFTATLQAIERGNTPSLPAKTTSLGAWSARVQTTRADLSYWQGWPATVKAATPMKPTAAEPEPNGFLIGDSETITITIDACLTKSLVQHPAAIYRMGVHQVLIAALARTLALPTGRWDMVLDLESHGREQGLFADVDLSRTLGWFTALYPMRLALLRDGGEEDDLLAVKAQMHQIPQGGLFFDRARTQTPTAHVLFNYLGRFDGLLQPPLLRRSNLATGSDRSPLSKRRHLLEVDALLLDDGLQMNWTFCKRHLEVADMGILLTGFQKYLQRLVDHCANQSERRLTPSDFPLASMTQAELDQLHQDLGEIRDIYPLTPVQEGMLFHGLYGQQNAAYFEQLTCRFEGSLEVESFRHVWTEMVQQTPALATAFAWEHLSSPLQVVSAKPTPEWHSKDLSRETVLDQDRLIRDFLSRDRRRGFNLDQAPLTRFALFRTNPTHWTFVWSYHHLLMDGWSMALVLDEVLSHYRGLISDQPMAPFVRSAYREFVAQAQTKPNRESQAYWKAALAGFSAPLVLPIQKGPPGHVIAHENRILPTATCHGLEQLGKTQGLTISTCIQAVWALILARYCHSNDVVFGLTVSGRESGLNGVTQMIGLLINTLPVRIQVQNQTLGPWLQRIQEDAIDREPHAGMALGKIQACSELETGQELFDSLLVIENYPLNHESLHLGLGFQVVDVHAAAFTHYGITLVARTHDGLQFQIGYDATRFEKAAVVRLLDHLQTMLTALPQSLVLAAQELPMLTQAEHRLLTQTWNREKPHELITCCIHQLFEVQAAKHPNREAIFLPEHTGIDGQLIPAQRLSYAQLNSAANRLAQDLQACGTGSETLVGLHVERSLELVIGILAILKAGAAYVPLDPAYPADRLAFMIADAKLAWVVCQSGMTANLPAGNFQKIYIENAQNPGEASTNPAAPSSTPLQTAYIIYTSGSTGKPKGVPVTHAHMVRLFGTSQDLFHFDKTDTWTLFHSYAFDFTVWELWGALIFGGRLVIVPQMVARSAEAFHQLVCDQAVTVLNQTPSAFLRLIQADEQASQPAAALRYVIFGGEALEPRSLLPWFQRYGDKQPQLINMYGITETTVHVTFGPITKADCERAGSGLGVRLPDLSLYLLDETMQPVPLGVKGEIFVGGAGVARGYLHRPALTAQRFLPNPFASSVGARLYRSGDLGRFRDEFLHDLPLLEYAGRCDFQVKIRGYRIELGEIEAALLANHAVRDAVVLAREDLTGPAGKQLVAYLCGEPDAMPTASAWRDSLSLGLPAYMIPSHFVVLDALPLTTHGKVDRAKLPRPSRTPAGEDQSLLAPQTSVEKQLAAIWAQVLDLETVGIRQRFFELGGDSILSIRVMTAAKRAGLQFSLAQLFQLQTIEKLAQVVDQSSGAEAAELAAFALVSNPDRAKIPTQVADAYPATQLQKGMLFHGEQERDAYHNLSSFHLEAPFDEGYLRQAVAAVIARHPVLRTAFDLIHFSQPLQLVYAQLDTPITFADWRDRDPQMQDRDFDRWFEEEKQRFFDWSKPGLLRCHVQRRGERSFQFTLSEHHAIVDGWSVASFLTEVFSFYFAFLNQASPKPPALPRTGFHDFVALEQQALAAKESARFWADHLESFEFTRIPRRLSRDDQPAHLEVTIEEPLSQGLVNFANQTGVPLKSALLAVHFRILALLSGSDDILTGLVANGRPEADDSERVLGLFLNTLPLRYHFQQESWSDLARAIFELEREALPHRRYPLAEIQKMFGGKPFFETAFNYTHFHIYQSIRSVAGLAVKDTRFFAPTHLPFAANFSRDLDSERILLSLDYRADVFPHDQVRAMGEFYLTALASMVANPDGSCRRVAFLQEPERARVLHSWNQTRVARPQALGLHDLVWQQVQKTPNKTAIVEVTPGEGERTLTYAALDAQSSRLANLLLTMGAAPDQPIALCLERSPQAIVSILAILKAGCGYLPLDPAYPDDRLSFIIADSGASMVIAQANQASRFERLVSIIDLDRDAAQIQAQPSSLPQVTIHPEAMAYIIYTSGSTGTPKGVVISHRAILNQILWRQQSFDLSENDRLLQNLSLSFDPSVWQIFWPLSIGAQLYLIPNHAQRDIPWLAHLMQEHRLAATAMVPSVLRLLLEEDAFLACDQLKHISCGGEGLPADLVMRFCDHFGEDGILHVVYGPTEATIDASTWLARKHVPSRIAPIGFPIHNAQLYVLDPIMEPVPPGVPGELFIAGAGLGRGYLNRASLTADRYVPNPFGAPGTRLYRSGDMVRYLDQGLLEFRGRVDHQVKVRGFRIELGELESILAQHEQIDEVVCMVREDQPGDKRLVAYLKSNDTTRVSPRAWLTTRVPEYMVPAVFVTLDDFPRLANDKINRPLLPQPEASDRRSASVYQPPRNPTETQLVAIWSGVLDLERVGVHDNFFELGGDSILSLQIIARAREVGFTLAPKDLFQNQTIADLAALAGNRAVIMAEQGPITGRAAISPIQNWFFERGLTHHFNQSVLLQVPITLDQATLQAALNRICDHHDALRLYFGQDDSGCWWQEHADPGIDVPLQVVTSSASKSTWPALIKTHASASQLAFDLNKPPLLGALLFHFQPSRGEPEARLFLLAHHLVVDSVSWRFILEDLQKLCRQLENGEDLRLPAKTSSFKDWTAKLHELAMAGEVLAEKTVWSQPGQTKSIRLDFPDGVHKNTVANARELAIELDPEKTRLLLRQVPAVYQTRIDEVLLTALTLAWRDWSNGDELHLDLESHGRADLFEDVDITRTVGWFTAAYPVQLHVAGSDMAWALKTIKQTLREIPREGIGYGLLRYLNPDTSAEFGQLPSPQVSFNYLGRLDEGQQTGPFQLIDSPTGSAHDPQMMRAYLLELNGFIKDGRLQFRWTWSPEIFAEARVQLLALKFSTALEQLIDHCLLPEAGGRTPADYPLASLDQPMVDQMVGNGSDVEDIYPLAPSQQDILFHVMYQEGAIFHQQLHFVIEQAIDVAGFRRAWDWTINRHPALRASFHWGELESPLQMVQRNLELPWHIQNWRDHSAGDQKASLSAYLRDDRSNPLAWDQAPLMRFGLFQLAEARYQFVWSHHHLLSDGWSLPLILRDVLAYYQNETLAKAGPGSRPFREYIAWLANDDLVANQAWWRDQLKGFQAATPLPLDRFNPSDQTDQSHDRQHRRLDQQETARLGVFARQHHLTVNTLVQGAWALLLARYSGRDDVLFGASVSGRPPELPGIEAMVGLFINTLPVRVLVHEQDPLLDWLKALQNGMRERESRSATPAAMIRAESEIAGDQPLYESIVVFENYPVDQTLRAGQFKISNLVVEEQTNFPLTLTAEMNSLGLNLNLNFHTHRFNRKQVGRILDHLTLLIGQMLTRSQGRLGDLELLVPGEEQALIALGQGRQLPPDPRCFHQLFEANARLTPTATAVVAIGDGETQRIQYGELDRRSNALAVELIHAGIGPETYVGIYLDKCIGLPIAMLAVHKAGAAYVPLDPDYPRERLAHMASQAGLTLILTRRYLIASLPVDQVPVRCLDDDSLDWSQQQPIANRTLPDHPAYLIFSSGSTGKPKGITVCHRAIVNAALAWQADYQLQQTCAVHLQMAAFSFDVFIGDLARAFVSGATLVLCPKAILLEPARLFQLMQAEAVDAAEFVPAVIRELAHYLETTGGNLNQLRLLAVGSDSWTVQEAARIKALCGPNTRLINSYGVTEATVDSTFLDTAGLAPNRAGSVPIGRPFTNTQIYLLDQQLKPVPIGIFGMLFIGGPGLARGYHQQPGQTAAKYLPNPFSKHGERIYRSDDAARFLADGNIEFLGRVDHQVKIRGLRIELGDIEAVLAAQTQVEQAVVVLRKDGPGAIGPQLVAYCVAEETLDLNDLRDDLRRQLPDYMVPGFTVVLAQLPLLPNGKIDRKALPAPAWASASLEPVAPRNQTETELVEIWSQVLGVEAPGVAANFFDLGGHSLMATRIISLIRARFKVALPLRALFENATIAQMGQLIDDSSALLASDLTLVKSTEEPVLSYGQNRLWFIDQMTGPSGAYNLGFGLRLKGDLNRDALEKAFHTMVCRHQSLRNRIFEHNGKPILVIDEPPARLTIDLTDLSNETDGEAAANQLFNRDTAKPFNLSRGSLLRLGLVRLGSDDHLLMITMHHIIADAWSIGIMVRELSVLYRALSLGQPSPLPELSIQYGDFAHWQRQYLQDGEMVAQIQWWQGQLRDAPPSLALPFDRPRPITRTTAGASLSFELGDELTEHIHGLAKETNTTLFMNLLGAYAVLLGRYSHSHDLVIGTPIANRVRTQLEPLIGFFVNTLALRIGLDDTSWRHHLARIREMTLDAFAHQDLPFERLVEALEIPRDLSHEPVFQVMFTLQNAFTDALDLPGLEVSAQMPATQTARFDLLLVLEEVDGGLRGIWEYNSDLFDRETVERMADHYLQLLQNLTAQPDRPVSQARLSSKGEQALLLETFHQQLQPQSCATSIQGLIEAQVVRTPHLPAIVFGEISLSYAELNERANRLALLLRQRGVTSETAVAISTIRSPGTIIGQLAILKAGGYYLPLDGQLPNERLQFMIEENQATLVLCHGEDAPGFKDFKLTILRLDQSENWPQATRNPANHTHPDTTAYVMYTSGSTGQPKGVVIPHRGVISLVENPDYTKIGEGDAVLHFASPAFDAATFEVWAPLVCGARICIFAHGPADATELANFIAHHRIQVAFLTSGFFNRLVASGLDQLGSLRYLMTGGEALSASHAAKCFQSLPDCVLSNIYGPTESTTFSSNHRLTLADIQGRAPIGQAIHQRAALLLDKTMAPTPTSVMGVLHIGGQGLARAYLNRPALTAQAFIPNPHASTPGERLYVTGDLVYRDIRSNLVFCGRDDDQVKIRGFRIEIGEIEHRLTQHPLLENVVVLLRDDLPGGKGLVAFMQARREKITLDEALDATSLTAFLRKTLPDYMVPAAFILLDQLPLNRNGKVDMAALARHALSDRLSSAGEAVAPRNQVEEQIATIWIEVLGLEKVSVFDNFFEIGGHSLLATQILSRIRDIFPEKLSLQFLFEEPTIAGIAKAIGNIRKTLAEPIQVSADNDREEFEF